MEEFIPFVFFFICIFIFQNAAYTEFVAGMKTKMKTNPGERTGKQLPMNRSTLATNGVRVSTIHG